jgi:hypothetical protein
MRPESARTVRRRVPCGSGVAVSFTEVSAAGSWERVAAGCALPIHPGETCMIAYVTVRRVACGAPARSSMRCCRAWRQTVHGGAGLLHRLGHPTGRAGLGVTVPFDKQLATVGNGCMVALQADSREQVDRLHARALELGGSDEGPPGQRSEGFTQPTSATRTGTSSTPVTWGRSKAGGARAAPPLRVSAR